MKEKLRKLYAHRHSLTEDGKRLITALIKENGLSIPLNPNCPNCYADAIVQACIILDVDVSEKGVTDSGNYMFNGHPCIWQPYGITIDRSTSDADIERFIAIPCYSHFFTKIEKEVQDVSD